MCKKDPHSQDGRKYPHNKMSKYDKVIVSISDPNDVWGKVIAEEDTFYRLESGRIAKKTTEGKKWHWKDNTNIEKSIYIVSIAESPWSDLGTRVILATNKEEAICLWEKASESIIVTERGVINTLHELKKSGTLYVNDIGKGSVSDVISITTG